MKTLEELGYEVVCSSLFYVEWQNAKEDVRISYMPSDHTIYARLISRMLPVAIKKEEMYALLEEIKEYESQTFGKKGE